jgi:UDP-glucuronate 4-epimerase
MKKHNISKTAIVTGAAGFIGFHISRRLLLEGWRVIGVDCLSTYYDVKLKQRREEILIQSNNYRSVHSKIEEPGLLLSVFKSEKPDIVIHLAAQAGVRYSIENPRAYLESNIIGTFELLEAARAYPPKHILLASTSSAYGANTEMPYHEKDKADHQVSFYAATKKSTENIAHSYAHIYNLPITMFRFFTVYGPWGRPDMAYFLFTEAILKDEEIPVFNNGNMERDFTYIDDLVNSLRLLCDIIPKENTTGKDINIDSLSPVAPFRVVNIGNNDPKALIKLISALELKLEKKANLKMLPMQKGDVTATWASNKLLKHLTGFTPSVTLEDGISHFIDWYKQEYQ